MQLMEISDQETWDAYVMSSPFGHPLQLWGWGEAKTGSGWTAHRLALVGRDTWVACAQVLMWQIPHTKRFVAYVPRGPIGEPGSTSMNMFLQQLVAWAKEQGAVYVRIEPAWTSGRLGRGWIKTRHHFQMSETYTVDLTQDSEAILAAMSRKHRQYVRQAERSGVEVHRESAGDITAVYDIYLETAQRAGFALHERAYYERVFGALGSHNYLYVAAYQDKPVAFLWLAAASETTYELYGGMRETAGPVHANYLLKWQAMNDAKRDGYKVYDFNGRVSPGVSNFKAGFGPDEVNYVGTYDYPIRSAEYYLFELLWPLAKPVGRRIAAVAKGRKN